MSKLVNNYVAIKFLKKKGIALHFVCIFTFWIIFIFFLLLTDINTIFAKDIFPALIIVYDDGYIQDLTKALPVHKKMNVPAVSSINPDTIGNKGKMSKKDLQKLTYNGWEIASHGQHHSFLGHNEVKSQIRKNSDKIEVKNIYFVEKRYDYLLCDAQNSKKEKIAIEDIIIDKERSYIKTKKPILHAYSEKSYLVMTQESMEQEIAGSWIKLVNMGFPVSSFMYPYNGYSEQARDIAKKHYRFARGGMREKQDFPEAFINTQPLNCFELKGTCFENDMLTDKDLDELLKKTVQSRGLLVLYAHTGNEKFSVKRLALILQTARNLGINIVTFRDLFAYQRT